MMVKWPAAISSAGALTIWTRLAFFAGGGTWAATGFEKIAAAIAVVISSFRIGLVMGSSSVSPSSSTSLRYRRIGKGRDGADVARARRKRRRGNESFIALRRCRAARTAPTRKSIDVGIRYGVPVGQRLQEGDDLVLLRIRQTELTGRHVEVVFDLGHRPAVDFFGSPRRAVSCRDRVGVHAAGIVEVAELLQALDVTVLAQPFLALRPRR